MFATIAMIFTTITNIFSSLNRLALASDHLAETAEQRASAYRDEQAEVNAQRLHALKSKVESGSAKFEL